MADRNLVVRIIGDDASLQRAFTRSSGATKTFNRDLSAATRGAAAGSGVFRSLGRSIVFASGGFLAFGGVTAFLRQSIDAAKEAQVAQAQLGRQLANNGQSLAAYRDQINNTVNRLTALSGIQNDELLAGLTTLLRTVPDVGKALRDLGTASDLARAKHISLSQAALIIAKTEAGNTTLLRRQGIQIAQNATAEQALATLRERVAGQARAGTTEQERFAAVLHETEEIIGTGILPTLNKYLEAGTRWLQQMDQSGKLEKDVANAAHDFSAAVGGIASVVKTVDKITGSFKNTLELLIGLKAASIFSGWATQLGLFATAEQAANESAVVSRINAYAGGVTTVGTAAVVAEGRLATLRTQLAGMSAAKFLIPVTIAITAEQVGNALGENLDFSPGKLGSDVKRLFGGHIDKGPLLNFILGNGWQSDLQSSASTASEGFKTDPAVMNTGLIVFKNLRAAISDAISAAISSDTGSGKGGLTAEQRNTFFDNAISRILLRGGLGNIEQQITALVQANRLIQQRLSVTKDVTRRLNLEDELLQNQAQIRDLRSQQAADALQKQQDARAKQVAALQARADAQAKALAALTAKEFKQLGLSATGDQPVPLVDNLKKQLAQLSQRVSGTTFDTPRLEAQFKRISKVLNESLVPKDVRSKIDSMFADIRGAFNQHLSSVQKDLTRFAHVNSDAVVKAVGGDLSSDQIRRLRSQIAQIGAGGTVPGRTSQAFGLAGAPTIQVHSTITLDGREVGRAVTVHQTKEPKRQPSRRG